MADSDVHILLRSRGDEAAQIHTALQQAAGGTLTATKQANPMVNSLLNALGVATK